MRALLIVLLVASANAQNQSSADLADRIRAAQTAGRCGEAADLYAQLIAAGSDSPQIRSNYGVMLHLAGRNRLALEQFHLVLAKDPSLAAANLFAGLSEIDLDQPAAALPFLERARQADPRQPAPLLALGKAHVALRHYALARENYSQAAALDPNLADAWYGLGITSRSQADEMLNRAARQGDTTAARQPKVQQLLSDALSALNRAIALDPASARTHLLLGESLADAGKFADAVAEFQTTLKLDPELTAAALGLASQFWKQHQFDQALPLVQQVLAKSPRDPEANGILADILQHAGKNAEAKRHAEIALAGNPDLIETHVVLARLYIAAQQAGPAIAELKKVIAADPDGSYHFLLYRAYRLAGDEAAAKQALQAFQHLRGSTAQP